MRDRRLPSLLLCFVLAVSGCSSPIPSVPGSPATGGPTAGPGSTAYPTAPPDEVIDALIQGSSLGLRLAGAFAIAAVSFDVASLPASALVETGTGNPPACSYKDTATKYGGTTDWDRSLLDTIYKLPSKYVPPDLEPTSKAGISGGGYVRSFVIAKLKAMTAAAKAAGAAIRVRSAYRSYATQVTTFATYVTRSGYAAAVKIAARPGHSEHQLGTTIDFGSATGAAPWNSKDWATSKAGAWMKANAWKYGFVMSYPKGKSASSCYSYEPWHYRYWGVTRAAMMHESGLVPRVWLWRTADY
jgi:D-alanyl-D-alanine carboxypeptidase